MTPEERVSLLERLDAIIRERNTWHDLRALDAYEDLWEMAYGQARLAVQAAAAARKIVEQDEPREPDEQPEPAPRVVVPNRIHEFVPGAGGGCDAWLKTGSGPVTGEVRCGHAEQSQHHTHIRDLPAAEQSEGSDRDGH